MRLRKLPRSFYVRPAKVVARDLLGKFLVRSIGRQRLVGMIVEVEAYLGERDPASHAFRGMTNRNAAMFREGGYLYVYFTYGMHFCSNVVTGREGVGRAVLLRAVEPVEGVDTMMRKRGLTGLGRSRRLTDPAVLTALCSGPARLCQAFGIARNENGTDLCGSSIWIAAGNPQPKSSRIADSTRIGLSAGWEHRWRYFIAGSPFVSHGRPSRQSHVGR